MHAQPPPNPDLPPPGNGRSGRSNLPRLRTTALVAALATAIGIGLGALIFDSGDEEERSATVETGVKAVPLDARLIDAAVETGTASGEGLAAEEAAATLVYLRGVADLNAAAGEISFAAEAEREQARKRRLRRANVYATATALSATAQRRRVRNAVQRSRLTALRGRAEAISARVDLAANKTRQAAAREAQRLNRELAQSRQRLARELQRASDAVGRELEEALAQIEAELEKPIAEQPPEGGSAPGSGAEG